MRKRTLIIIVLIGVAMLPAAVGYILRQQIISQLVTAGVPEARIVSVAGWLNSRIITPLPNQSAVEADLRVRHGPYLGGVKRWGWADFGGELLHLRQPVAIIDGHLAVLGDLSLGLNSTQGLRDQLPMATWRGLNAHIQGRITEQSWRGRIELSGFSVPQFAVGQLNIAWQWTMQPRPVFSLWLDAEKLHHQTAGGALDLERFKLNSDWLEQGQSGSLRCAVSARGGQGGGGQFSRASISLNAAPLDAATVRALPSALPALLGQPQALTLHLSPLLALQPRVRVDQVIFSRDQQAIELDGELILRSGGAKIHSQGGGPRSLFTELIRVAHYSRPLSYEEAELQLIGIQRQGWLQGRDENLRADIIINY